MTLLWHREEPIGICVFVSPPMSLAPRNRYFGLTGRWNRTFLRTLGAQLVLLQRVVLHPTYRGAGIATPFVRRSCALCPYPWIEVLTQMGHIHPFFERAGFIRVGTTRPKARTRRQHSAIYGGKKPHGSTKGFVTRETFDKSRFTNPVYYILDNRKNVPHSRRADVSPS